MIIDHVGILMDQEDSDMTGFGSRAPFVRGVFKSWCWCQLKVTWCIYSEKKSLSEVNDLPACGKPGPSSIYENKCCEGRCVSIQDIGCGGPQSEIRISS